MERNNKQSWEDEFIEFLGVAPAEVPQSLSRKVLDHIGAELRPSAIKVFGKVSLIQFAVGLFTLLFCPQFGISFTTSHGIMPYLMKFGESVCMLGCGALFTGLSLFIASLVLKPEEVRVFKKNEVLQLASLATLSLGALICVGGEVVLTLGVVWLLGAVAGGAFSLATGWALRKYFLGRAVI